jgi:putative membrane protein insertion efficiency factor
MTNSEPTFSAPLNASKEGLPLPTRAVVGLIRSYQWITRGRMSPCRFYPSCSMYAVEAVQIHGVARGSILATRRVLKCRPLGPHGIDLVPEAKKGEMTTP